VLAKKVLYRQGTLISTPVASAALNQVERPVERIRRAAERMKAIEAAIGNQKKSLMLTLLLDDDI